jgi:asparagine N-glycosylation enzyme membrane subunit Stt3
MKFNYLTPPIILIGIAVLFLFPEPETNFLAYISTALIFIMLTIFSIIWEKRKKKNKSKIYEEN